MKLILASASKGRKHLLNLLKIPYEVMPTDIEEEKIIGKTPLESIRLRAKLKSEEALKRIIKGQISPPQSKVKTIDKLMQLQYFVNGCLILSADTEVVFNNELIGKPKDEKEAIEILKLLSGKTHEVITAIYASLARCHLARLNTWNDYDRSLVTFRRLKDEEIDRYLRMTEFTRYTGGYALLASPQDFVIKTEGSLSNIIGLPLEKVIPILRENKLLS